MSGRIPQTFKEIVKEKFNISNSYASRLRWLGKLWVEYKKIGQLSMTLNQFYSHRQQVDSLFRNYSHLANEWKIIDQQNLPINTFSSSNPFVNQNHSTNPFL